MANCIHCGSDTGWNGTSTGLCGGCSGTLVMPPPMTPPDPAGRIAPSEDGHHYGSPLQVKVEHGALVIRIGVQTLAHAVSYSDWANPYDEAKQDYIRTFAITDAPAFAKDVAYAMLSEREDGSSPLSDFLDKMSEAAIDDGSIAVKCDQSIKHGTTSPLETWAIPAASAEKGT